MSQSKVSYIDHCGSDLTTVNAARVSFGKKSRWEGGSHPDFDSVKRLSDKDTKLIHYLAKHKHKSPFGHCFASFHVKAPIFVARQLVKHKFLRWNEISRRYVDEEPEFYVPEVWRGKSEDKKQGSAGEVVINDKYMWCDEPKYGWDDYTVLEMLGENQERPVLLYNRLLELGVAPEQARMVLPVSQMTEWYWSGSLDAFADMCNLRCKEDTQWETRQIANQIDEEMGKLYPVAWEALRAYAD